MALAPAPVSRLLLLGAAQPVPHQQQPAAGSQQPPHVAQPPLMQLELEDGSTMMRAPNTGSPPSPGQPPALGDCRETTRTPTLDTPAVVRDNERRRIVCTLGSAGKTPKEVREVQLTPLSERRAKQFGPKADELTFDSGFEGLDLPPKPSGRTSGQQEQGRGERQGQPGKNRGKKKKKKKKKKR
jgi:hypothetical protein